MTQKLIIPTLEEALAAMRERREIIEKRWEIEKQLLHESSKERERAYQRWWKKTNSDKKKEYNKKSYARQKKAIADVKKRDLGRYTEIMDVRRARSRKYYHNNKDVIARRRFKLYWERKI